MSNTLSTPIPKKPQVINNSSDIVIEEWEYLSPRSNEVPQVFPSQHPNATAFGSNNYEAYVVWHETGFDVIWGNVICSVQPILIINSQAIELWLNDDVSTSCDGAEVIHAFKVKLEAKISPNDWMYTLHTDAP